MKPQNKKKIIRRDRKITEAFDRGYETALRELGEVIAKKTRDLRNAQRYLKSNKGGR